MLSLRTAIVCLWVGAALCAGAAPELRAEPFTLSNACLEDREACLNALDGEAQPMPELAAQAVAARPDTPILLSNRHLGLSREDLAALGVVEGEPPVEQVVEHLQID